jgi:hypothetical protein
MDLQPAASVPSNVNPYTGSSRDSRDDFGSDLAWSESSNRPLPIDTLSVKYSDAGSQRAPSKIQGWVWAGR